MPSDLRLAVLEADEPLYDEQPLFRACVWHDDHNRANMAIYADHVWCYACDTYMRAETFAAKYLPNGEAVLAFTKTLERGATYKRSAAKRSPLHLESMAASSQVLLWRNPQALAYLYQRGLDEPTIQFYGLGHTGFSYVLPVTGAGGEVLSLRYRRDDRVDPDGKHKYWGERGYNDLMLYPHALENEAVIVLTEGEFDALVLRAHGIPAYSFTNGSMSGARPEEVRALLAGVRRVVLAGDQDTQGLKTMAKLTQTLRGSGMLIDTLTWQVSFGKDMTALWQYSECCVSPTPFEQVVGSVRHIIGQSSRPGVVTA